MLVSLVYCQAVNNACHSCMTKEKTGLMQMILQSGYACLRLIGLTGGGSFFFKAAKNKNHVPKVKQMHVMHAVAEPQERYLPQRNAGSYIQLETLAHPTTSLAVRRYQHINIPSFFSLC